jgi:hypothetical protein
MEAGEPVREICQTHSDIPSWQTICRWRRENDEFAAGYARAREASAESCEHNALDAVISATNDDAQIAKARSDAWRWAAAKRNPRTHGDKVDLNVSGAVTLESLVLSSIARPVLEATAVPPTIEHEG